MEEEKRKEEEKGMEDDKVAQAVMAYLKSKGYRQAELAFSVEQQSHRNDSSESTDGPVDPSIANPILFYSRADSNPGRYKEAYSKLRAWVHSSLDNYKNELLRILYPVFLHSYMDLVAKGFPQEAREFLQVFREDHDATHHRDIQKLESILSPQHLQESEFALMWRKDKTNIKICQYSFELLLQYLHGTDSMLMLGIVNEHLNIQVFPGQPSPLPKEEDSILQGTLDYMSQKEIRWGGLEDSLEERIEKEIAAENEKAQAEGKDTEGEDAKKRAADGKSGGTSNKKAKKDRTSTAGPGSITKSNGSVAASAPRVKPELPMPSVYALCTVAPTLKCLAG